VIIGVLPGLGGANGVAILLPLTFAWRSSRRRHLGDHPAVLHLLGRPVRRRHHLDPVQHSRASPGRWRPPSTAIRWRSRGRAGAALTAAFTSSFVGALVAVIVITFLSPIVAKFALEFGPPNSLPSTCYLLRLHRHVEGAAVQDASPR
jgi:putative tricarboxylic transport membrane protein